MWLAFVPENWPWGGIRTCVNRGVQCIRLSLLARYDFTQARSCSYFDKQPFSLEICKAEIQQHCQYRSHANGNESMLLQLTLGHVNIYLFKRHIAKYIYVLNV